MTALLTSCMILLGRPQDAICHVLVNEPYDNSQLAPPFLFPEKGCVHRIPNVKRVFRSSDAKISLAWIPFVPLMGQIHGKTCRISSYMEMVRRVTATQTESSAQPYVEMDIAAGLMMVAGKPVRLSPFEFGVLAAWLLRFKEQRGPLNKWGDLLDDLKLLAERGQNAGLNQFG